MADPSESGGLRDAIMASAARLGISPSDLATAISYETSGSFDPWKKGPRTQWGEHRGLIQWGEPQRKKYGVTAEMSVGDQLQAVERYLTDAGVKPGHGLLDVYSAINAGRVGLYNRSDAHNGGAPGSVADKVASMAGHRVRANALLGMGGSGAAPGQVAAAPQAAAAVPMSFAPPTGDGAADPEMAAALARFAAISNQPEAEPMAKPTPLPRLPLLAEPPAIRGLAPKIQYAAPPGLARARAIAQAMSRSALG